MTPVEIITLIVVGVLAGWLGSLLFKGKGMGLVVNFIIGIIGCFLGSWLFDVLDISLRLFKGDWKWLNSVIIGAIGAFLILLVINLVFKKGKKK